MDMRAMISLVETAGLVKLYHITNKPKFKLDRNYSPTDNSFSIDDRSGNKGIYLTKDVERWVNGHGYIRPFVAEILAEPAALEYDQIGRWSAEVFVPAEHFDKLTVNRVVPLDAIAREMFGSHGWIENSHGYEFDTGDEIKTNGWERPFQGYTYDKDVRNMSAEEVQQMKQRFAAGYKVRRQNR
jgi:hypothetical protein